MEATRVRKAGRTTGVTEGIITAIEVDNVKANFEAGLIRFDDQIEIDSVERKPFSRGGDSGSLICDSDSDLGVGLLFAGSSEGGQVGSGVTFAAPLAKVLEELESVILT